MAEILSMSSTEFTYWQVLESIEPLDDVYWRSAMIAYAILKQKGCDIKFEDLYKVPPTKTQTTKSNFKFLKEQFRHAEQMVKRNKRRRKDQNQ